MVDAAAIRKYSGNNSEPQRDIAGDRTKESIMQEQSNNNLFQRACRTASRLIEALQFAAPLLTRLMVGITFFYTGYGKLQNLERTASFFSDLGIPFPGANAIFISSLEFIGGICLMAGLGTRIFAALLSSTMVAALLTADKDSFVSKFPADLTDLSPVVLLLFLVWLVLYGPGAASLDRLIGHLARRRKGDDPAAGKNIPEAGIIQSLADIQ
jgi:putative oxidoreductase